MQFFAIAFAFLIIATAVLGKLEIAMQGHWGTLLTWVAIIVGIPYAIFIAKVFIEKAKEKDDRKSMQVYLGDLESRLQAVVTRDYYIQRWRDRLNDYTADHLAWRVIETYQKDIYMGEENYIKSITAFFDAAAEYLTQYLPQRVPTSGAFITGSFPVTLPSKPWPLKEYGGTELFALLREDYTTREEPINIPDDTRFEHQFVRATSGSGKTTLLKAQIIADFDRVARGEATIIVIDGENEMIPELAHLAVFGRGGKLENRLVLLEADAEYPVSLNIFQTPKLTGTPNEIAEAQKEIRETVRDCISAVNDIQRQLLDFLIEFCLVIPNANMLTLLELLKPGGLRKHARYLKYLDVVVRGYFESTFIAKNSQPTQDALLLRLHGMLSNPTFAKMFMQERSLFDMQSEIEKGKVILINTRRALLGDEGCQMMGRFFLAQLMQASMRRNSSSLPVYCYVDELQDCVADYARLGDFLLKARKRRIGMILATQQMRKLDGYVAATLTEDTAIRFSTTGREMERGNYQLYVRRKYVDPISVQVHKPSVEPAVMSESNYQHILAGMRARYCAPSRHNALTIYDPYEEPAQRPYRPDPPPNRVFDAEWWEVNDDPAPPPTGPRRLAAPDNMPEVPQPGRRRRRR